MITHPLKSFLSVLLLINSTLLFSQLNPVGLGQLYRDDVMPRIDITIDPNDFNTLLFETTQDSEYVATFNFNNTLIDKTLDSVGFRLRGNVSRLSEKKSFKISVNTFIKGRKFEGAEDINLVAAANDPLMLRPRLAYYMAKEAGLVTLNTNYALLYVNNDFQGVYIISEQIDKTFLKKWFGNNDGNLYKGRCGADLKYWGDNQQSYKNTLDLFGRILRSYDLQTNTEKDDYSDLVQLTKKINSQTEIGFKDSIAGIFDVNSYLKTLAFEVFIGHWDSYITYAQNFMLYHDTETGLFNYITYDTDLTLGIDIGNFIATCDIYSPSPSITDRPLIMNLLAVKEYRDIYTFYHRQLIEKFPLDTLRSVATRLKEKVEPYILSDPYLKTFSKSDFDNNLDQPAGMDRYGLLPFLTERIKLTKNQMDNSNVAPIISRFKIDGQYLTDTLSVSCMVENEKENLNIVLMWQLNNQEWNQVEMNTNTYQSMPLTTWCSANLPPLNETGQLNVKIIATDAKGNTTTFPRSGNYLISIFKQGKSLKINEIMAKNQSSITDDYGQHEDWIEIANCDTTAVNTAQSYLSDDAQDLGKWQLPSTLMNPGELIYVWADDDEKQGDLHTNFKLDGEGETIYLSVKHDTLFSIIDSLKYAKLPSDISYGALAEGSGNYSVLPVITPGYPNSTRGLAFAVFNVDMAEEIGENRFYADRDVVDVVANINYWNGTVAFNDPDNDLIYTYTDMNLSEGDEIVYRYRLNKNNSTVEFGDLSASDHHRKITLHEGCNTINDSYNRLFTTIKHFNSGNEFFFYPNPAQHYITINKTLRTDRISIFNLTGRKVYEFSLDENDSAPIDISVLPDGIYWVKAVDSGKTYTAKMIKISR